MKISSIVDIVQGDLKYSPAISFITQIHTNIKKINDGDMFISSSLQDIKIAVDNGAFAILYDVDIDINKLNNEIAFIKVKSIKNAMVKLLRFNLSNKNIKSIIVDEITYNIFEIYKYYLSNTIFLNNDISNNFELIQNNKEVTVLISTNKILLNNIYPKSFVFDVIKYELSNLVVHSLFETSFSYKNKYLHKIKLPLIYIDHFINVVEFLKLNEVDTSKMKSFKYMQSIFLNNSNQIIEYGKSNRFIIANNDITTNYVEIAFLKKFYSYGKIKILDNDDNQFILKEIQKNDYNALYIKSKNYLEIFEIIETTKKELIRLF